MTTTSYKKNAAYIAYTRGNLRPDVILPPLARNNDGLIFLAPGEVYCRFRFQNGTICPINWRFPTYHALHDHYSQAHGLELERLKSGALPADTRRDVEHWYKALMGNVVTVWTPRSAHVRGHSPPPVSRPDLDGI
ncbi:hypothetical protein BGZ61DRAFT_536212 [Ilyonectria robusta]|uniref:uncharacterized protein n=1 Tax=Ilyonectria robusta TaxID=1079257 RepID=UPI001E8D2278|nr:uncharacterized protein BGZ61DRAFT_536212 [Ilyonectria robusta]KAH8674902.1 hypothetical protein BGZ61DRAFT_536212 [Ilyonectria robusta]